jgi:hypothetical protein
VTDRDETTVAVIAYLDKRRTGSHSAGVIAEGLDWRYPETRVRRRLRKLAKEGVVEEIAGPRGSKWRLR